MTKYCTQCGTELTDTQKFCNKCGLRLTPTQPTEPAPAAQTYPQSYPGAGGGPAPYQQPSYQPPPAAQAPYQGGYPPQAPTQMPYGSQPQAGGLSPNIVGALCYIVILGVIFLLIDPYNKDRFIRFHAWQAIFFFVAWMGLRIVLGVMSFALGDILGFLLGAMSLLIFLGLFVAWLWMIYQAYQGKMAKLPIIGDFAAQQAG